MACVMTGQELGTPSDADLSERARTATVFARVMPEQKLRIVNALRSPTRRTPCRAMAAPRSHDRVPLVAPFAEAGSVGALSRVGVADCLTEVAIVRDGDRAAMNVSRSRTDMVMVHCGSSVGR